MKTTQFVFPTLAASSLLGLSLAAMADPPGHHFKDWVLATEVTEVNSDVGDGCPIESPDGLSLYLASPRTGTLGGNDIWASDRATKDDPFSAPVNLGPDVNSDLASDYCPTPLEGRWLMFVSERAGPETCSAGPGSGDIYLIRQNAAVGWGEPRHLGCLETGTGPNSVGSEFSPSLVTTKSGTHLYFSSNVNGNQDIYVSRLRKDGVFGPPRPVRAWNTEFDDRMPNVSADGLEAVFSSDRPVSAKINPTLDNSFDVYVSTRPSLHGRWSKPKNLGPNINTAGSETRSTLSGDLERLYFGRDGEIYSSSREKRKRHDDHDD